ncbi:hypothetical protein Val02_18990 [Virgisporangium aliadipatigenens]|uniref:Peptidase M10 metallopeptidase domain-containing protein n=1 Tax=Virgisporangium aliadipatigenens TaxID=741659 RepID=A0A8J4DPU1_9ACTN|nr:matrixin family metalloprotease [Virgisporangium aliadipatigenens]GIJ45013.1 hypothetical protein Val02_18990 [Virgisporangium aliadipatigenens]
MRGLMGRLLASLREGVAGAWQYLVVRVLTGALAATLAIAVPLIVTRHGDDPVPTAGRETAAASPSPSEAAASSSGPPPVEVPVSSDEPTDLPTVPVGTEPATSAPRTTKAAPSPTAGGALYKLLYVDAQGRAARLNPCASVSYRINPANAPSRAEEDIAEAVRRVSVATGIPFTYAGESTAAPVKNRGTDPTLLFAFASAPQTDLLDGWSGVDVKWTQTANGPVIVGGTIVLDAAKLNAMAPGFVSGVSRGALLMHELGHVAGLADSTRADDVMYGRVTESKEEPIYSTVDRAGLKALGKSAGCLAG